MANFKTVWKMANFKTVYKVITCAFEQYSTMDTPLDCSFIIILLD